MKWIRNFLENKNINAMKGEILELRTRLHTLEINLFDYIDGALRPIIKRDAVRRSRAKKALEEDESETEKTLYNDGFDEIRKLNRENKQDGTTNIN